MPDIGPAELKSCFAEINIIQGLGDMKKLTAK